jgi:hypothetical protein
LKGTNQANQVEVSAGWDSPSNMLCVVLQVSREPQGDIGLLVGLSHDSALGLSGKDVQHQLILGCYQIAFQTAGVCKGM